MVTSARGRGIIEGEGAPIGGFGQAATFWLIVAGFVPMFLVLQVGTTWLTGFLDQPASAIVATVVMLALALGLERLFFGRGVRAALDALGYRRPGWRALAVAAVIAAVMLAFFPVFAAVTGASVRLRADWWWILIGAIALNGLAEETLFRGFVFGGLRRTGSSFWRAGLISLVIFAGAHLFLFIQNPPLVASLATLVAVATAIPMAFLFERGNNSIAAPVVLHVAAHSIRFVEVPEPHTAPALTAWLVLQVGAPFLVLAFRRWLVPQPRGRVMRSDVAR